MWPFVFDNLELGGVYPPKTNDANSPPLTFIPPLTSPFHPFPLLPLPFFPSIAFSILPSLL